MVKQPPMSTASSDYSTDLVAPPAARCAVARTYEDGEIKLGRQVGWEGKGAGLKAIRKDDWVLVLKVLSSLAINMIDSRR